MSSSYQKLKRENNELKAQIAVLRHELGIVILCPDSYEAAEIKSRVRFQHNERTLLDMMIREDRKPPYKTGGIIPYLQHPRKQIIVKHNEP